MDTLLGPTEKITQSLDLASDRGLEIGALYNPRLRKSEANIWYLDHASTEELRAKYEGNPDAEPHLANLVDVDYVCTPPATLLEAVGRAAPFDYVIASHVIEHIPDVLGWLAEVDGILKPGGYLKLVIPDKRYCFDVNRTLTSMADLVDAHLRSLRIPSVRQMYDFAVNFLPVDMDELWAGRDVSSERRNDVPDADAFAYEFCLNQQRTGAYEDVHCSTFTPASFVDLLERSGRLGLTAFVVDAIFPTPRNDREFFVSLRKVVPGEARRPVEHVVDVEAPSHSESDRGLPPGHEAMVVSALERRIVSAKRSVASVVRESATRVRALRPGSTADRRP